MPELGEKDVDNYDITDSNHRPWLWCVRATLLSMAIFKLRVEGRTGGRRDFTSGVAFGFILHVLSEKKNSLHVSEK